MVIFTGKKAVFLDKVTGHVYNQIVFFIWKQAKKRRSTQGVDVSERRSLVKDFPQHIAEAVFSGEKPQLFGGKKSMSKRMPALKALSDVFLA